jgi:PAS domain S-box-containing protein
MSKHPQKVLLLDKGILDSVPRFSELDSKSFEILKPSDEGPSMDAADSDGDDDIVLMRRSTFTELKQKERSLRESEERFRRITDNMVDLISQYDTDNTYLYASPSFEKVLGYRPEELIGKVATDLLHPEDREKAAIEIGEMLTRGFGSVQFRYLRKDGEFRWVESTGRIVADEQGNFAGSIMGSRDITERKLAEDKLKTALGQKEILLHELQHRAKNSLGIVHGLLGMGMDEAKDPVSHRAFRSAQDRVRAMASIYTQLNKSADLQRVDLRVYLEELSSALLRSYADGGRIKLVTDIAEARIDTKRAMPLGLIVNELVTNALKYAYPQGARGEIAIVLEKAAEGLRLVVSDSGIGLAPGIEPLQTETTGLKLVAMLSEQLGGKLTITSSQGVEVALLFAED